jgi:hypothetical protein
LFRAQNAYFNLQHQAVADHEPDINCEDDANVAYQPSAEPLQSRKARLGERV